MKRTCLQYRQVLVEKNVEVMKSIIFIDLNTITKLIIYHWNGKIRKQYQFRKNKGSVSHHRREVIMNNSSNFCIFEVTQLHCREHIQKSNHW